MAQKAAMAPMTRNHNSWLRMLTPPRFRAEIGDGSVRFARLVQVEDKQTANSVVLFYPPESEELANYILDSFQIK